MNAKTLARAAAAGAAVAARGDIAARDILVAELAETPKGKRLTPSGLSVGYCRAWVAAFNKALSA
jgi:hypothetical protein